MNDGIERIGVGSVELIPVAAPNHPLASSDSNAPGAGRESTQLVLSDRSLLTKNKDFAPMVQEDLDSGRLVQLNIPEYKSGNIPSTSSTARICHPTPPRGG